MSAPFTVGLFLYVWSFLLWSFRIWYKVVSSTCYIFHQYFFCIGSVKLLQNLRLLPKLMLYYYYLNFYKPFLIAWEEMFNWDASFYSVSQLLNYFPDLPLFTSLLFSNDRWNLTAPFLDNSQVVLNNWSLLKAGNYCLTSNKLQSILHAIWTRVIYTLIFAASLSVWTLQLWPVRTHLLLLSSYVVQVSWVYMYKLNRLPGTG